MLAVQSMVAHVRLRDDRQVVHFAAHSCRCFRSPPRNKTTPA